MKKKASGPVIALLFGIACMFLAAAMYFIPKSAKAQNEKPLDLETAITNTPVYTTSTKEPTYTPSPSLEVMDSESNNFIQYDIDSINRNRESFMYILNFFMECSDFEKFKDPFKNKDGGYTYMHSSGSAVTFKENDKGLYTEIHYYSKLAEELEYDNELTYMEADTFTSILTCAFGTDAMDNKDIYNFLDSIISSDPNEILFECELEYENYFCLYQSSPIWGQILNIKFEE